MTETLIREIRNEGKFGREANMIPTEVVIALIRKHTAMGDAAIRKDAGGADLAVQTSPQEPALWEQTAKELLVTNEKLSQAYDALKREIGSDKP